MRAGKQTLADLLALPQAEAERIIREMHEAAVARLHADWPTWVREGQAPPPGVDWRVWVMLAGRGFGKTRAGAEWISQLAREHPGALFALVAANVGEARKVMVEGRNGLLGVASPDEREHMVWEPSRRRLLFASGAEAFLYSGADGESLRGPEHHFAWCDELAKWRRAEAAWDNLLLGLRLGENPRALVTTTPRAIPLIKAIVADQATARTRGSSDDNPHVSERHLDDMKRRIGGTRLGRQELDGELLDDVEAALWPGETIEASRTAPWPPAEAAERLIRVVVGVDPPASATGACGIVVCGLDEEGIGHVLADLSVAGLRPEGWARKVAAAVEAWDAQAVIAETNNGGDMVEAVLRGAGIGIRVKPVHAAEGKSARAAPVATLFESGRAKLAGRFPALEAEMAGLSWAGGYQGPGKSPDRADAMTWAMTELMLGRPRAEPRIRQL